MVRITTHVQLKQVILTADTPVVDHPGGIIFTSTDAGATFRFIQLPFHLAQPITYHFLNPDLLVALSIEVGHARTHTDIMFDLLDNVIASPCHAFGQRG